MRIMLMLLAIGSVWCTIASPAETTPIDPVLARQYFDEIKKVSDADAGHLWGVQLYGPTLFVDPNSRSVVANQIDQGGLLTADQGVYIGTLPYENNISNTAVEWSGIHWTMVNWNAVSNTDPYDRKRLLIHESWHRIQREIGIPSVITSNIYLDDLNGRVSLLLEFRALVRALSTNDPSDKKKAIGDALTFRQYRQSEFSENNENAFERHEGMAEYTGLKLCGFADSLLVRIVAKKLQLSESKNGLANSFAYLTGPALGLLLDHYSTDWRGKVRAGADLPSLLAAAIDWDTPLDKEQLLRATDEAGARYEAAKLLVDETGRAQRSGLTLEIFRDRLLTHGRLLIPNDNLRFSFNPQEKLVSFDTIGVIYETMRLTGDFGVLEVTNGVLRTNDWQFFVVAAPHKVEDKPIAGEGYTLKLNPGWQIVIVTEGKRVYVVERQ